MHWMSVICFIGRQVSRKNLWRMHLSSSSIFLPCDFAAFSKHFFLHISDTFANTFNFIWFVNEPMINLYTARRRLIQLRIELFVPRARWQDDNILCMRYMNACGALLCMPACTKRLTLFRGKDIDFLLFQVAVGGQKPKTQLMAQH